MRLIFQFTYVQYCTMLIDLFIFDFIQMRNAIYTYKERNNNGKQKKVPHSKELCSRVGLYTRTKTAILFLHTISDTSLKP